jgi:hypothetical protein
MAVEHELNLRVQGSGFRVQGSGFRVQGSGSRVHRVQGSGSVMAVEHELHLPHSGLQRHFFNNPELDNP